jgi:hypothetical protein
MMPRTTIHDLLEAARARLERLGPDEALATVDAGAMLVDIRSESQRERDACAARRISSAASRPGAPRGCRSSRSSRPGGTDCHATPSRAPIRARRPSKANAVVVTTTDPSATRSEVAPASAPTAGGPSTNAL